MRIALLISAALAATPAIASNDIVDQRVRVQTGTFGDSIWQAQSRIIGMTPTSVDVSPGVLGGGNPIFFPGANKSGVVALIMERSDGTFICSGSLLADRVSILTAAHCVSDGFGTPDPVRTTAFFFTGDPNERTPFSLNARSVDVSQYIINPRYTGEVIDQNDIAVLRLERGIFGVDAYDLFTDPNIGGAQYTVAGYGGRSTIGGSFGADARTGFLREGDNTYDYRWGDAAFGGFFTDRDANGENFFGFADVEHSWVSDFDSGLAVNDMGCRIAAAVGAPAGFACNTGVGAREVGVAGGDSGGPQFIDGRIASVTSYGLSFGVAFGDCRIGLNSSCGEFSGWVPVYLHTDFIANAMAVPEPATWGMMIAGFGLVGFAARRRRDGDMAKVSA